MLRVEIILPKLKGPSSSIPTYFCAPVRWFGHFSCVIFFTFVTCIVHFCPQVQQFGHFANFPLRPFSTLDSYFCAPVRLFGHFSCVTFCTFVTFLVHFCPQVQQFGHFCNFPAVTFFCAFACCTSIFADRRKGLATFSILHQFFTILQFSTLGPLKLLRLSTKVDC